MRLITRDHPDHEDFENPELYARIGCGICELRGKPIWVCALPDDNEVVTDVQLHERMAAWSREHAATHTEQEHEDHHHIRVSESPDPERVKRLLVG